MPHTNAEGMGPDGRSAQGLDSCHDLRDPPFCGIADGWIFVQTKPVYICSYCFPWLLVEQKCRALSDDVKVAHLYRCIIL